jgi:hypothetical protein
MLARYAILNPWIFRDFLDGTPKLSTLPSISEIYDAEGEFEKWTHLAKTKKKFVDFHVRNFERLKLGKNNTLQDIPKTRHLIS